MDENERLEMLGKKEKKMKTKKEKKRLQQSSGQGTSDECVKLLKAEMDEMRKTIARLSSESTKCTQMTYALGFDPDEYMSMGFIESANWIGEKIAIRMRKRMNEMPGRWTIFKLFKPPEIKTLVTCVAYNRGDTCRQGKWHTFLKRASSNPEIDVRQRLQRGDLDPGREELRVHACTLCWKGIGVLSMHHVLECPWISEDNWK
jgi:hypothetical protein